MDVLAFLYLEDFGALLLDMLHGAMHECYCFGFFSSDSQGLKLLRYNRWSWDVVPSWTARRVVLTPLELKEQRLQILSDAG